MTIAPAPPFANLWDHTLTRLAPLGIRDLPLAPEFSEAEGGGGRTRLRAAHFSVNSLGACRIVRITGAASEIVNAWLFPCHTARTPIFAAELLAFGGRPRLAFLDLQSAGLCPERRRRAADLTRPLSVVDEAPPEWAVASSCGEPFFTRSDAVRSAVAYRAYLDAWVAMSADAWSGGESDYDTLREYKAHHLTHSPGRAYLDKLFGAEWAWRFLHEFLFA